MLERERVKLADLHRGIKDMKHLPAALFFVDGIHERIAISEARILGIPTFGIVDSNTDPRNIDFPIPANDDSMKTIGLIVNYFTDTIIEATGGTSQMDEPVESNTISTDKEETETASKSLSDDSADSETDSDTKKELEEKLVIAPKDEEVSEDVQEKNKE